MAYDNDRPWHRGPRPEPPPREPFAVWWPRIPMWYRILSVLAIIIVVLVTVGAVAEAAKPVRKICVDVTKE